MPAEGVAELLDRWGRARTRSQQLQVAAAGARTLRSSSPADRRVLAQALLERGLPQAAAQLGAASAGRLSAQELADLVATLRDVEPGTLGAVARSVADPTEHQRLLAAAGGVAAAGVAADGAVADDVVADGLAAGAGTTPPPPAGVPTGPAVALPPPELLDDPPAAPPPPDGPTPQALAVQDPGTDEPTAEEPVADRAPRPAEPLPAHEPPAADVDVDGVLRAVERAPRVLDRLREVTEAAGAPLRTPDLVALLRALPDGWQRRTAAKRLLGAGRVHEVDTARLLEVFGRASDRAAVAQALVATGLADLATVTDHLEPAAAARLRRRSGR